MNIFILLECEHVKKNLNHERLSGIRFVTYFFYTRTPEVMDPP